MIESKGYKITPIDGDLAVSRNAEIGGDADIHGKARVAGSLKVEGFLDAPHIKGAAKGLFNTVEELEKEFQNPRPGWFAIVLDATDKTKGILYKAENRTWVATTDEAKPYKFIQDSINVFASKNELIGTKEDLEATINITAEALADMITNIKGNALQYNKIGFSVYADKIELYAKNISDNAVRYDEIPAATAEKAGVMSAEDKRNLNNSTVKVITWNNDTDPSNMNDFTIAGVYDIKGERKRIDDNLPVLNTGGGHSFNARLTVLDSSISGSGKDDDKCITQVLSFSNRLGQGEVYIRTGKGSSLDNLTWDKWSTLQRNVNVGSLESKEDLRNYIDNGIYSGVFRYGSSNNDLRTFVMVVINDYAIGLSPRRVSQFLYSIDKATGKVSYETQTCEGETWKGWEILNKGEIDSMIKSSVDNAIKGVIAGAPETFDTLKEIADWIANDKTGAVALVNAINTEITRAKEAEEEISHNAIAADSMGYSTTTDDMSLEFETLDGGSSGSVTFPSATTEQAGVMSTEDKRKLDNVPSAIESAIVEESKATDEKIATEKTALMNGDTIVGQAREIHSRNGKTVTDSFLVRTTAGSGTIGDGVASLKSVGGNIMKNLVDKVDSKRWATASGSLSVSNGIMHIMPGSKSSQIYWNDVKGRLDNNIRITGHKYYYSCIIKSHNADSNIIFGIANLAGSIFESVSAKSTSSWQLLSMVAQTTPSGNYLGYTLLDKRDTLADIYATNFLCIDLTELFDAGNEPTKEVCDKLFGTMDALPQGLSIAKPTTFTSTGFNQWNPKNVIPNTGINDNAFEGELPKHIAVVECLPCKVGVGENNGYCIHGDFSDDVKVYLTPLNPMEVEGELYMHELTKDATTDTYVPLIKGYMLVEVPTTDNLCAHFLWSEDKCERDSYEPYFESKIELPTIPQMSEWGLAGIQSSGTLAADTIDLDRMVYTKRVGCVDMGSLNYSYSEANNVFNLEPYVNKGFNFKGGGAILASAYTTASAGYADSARPDKTIYAAYNKIRRIHIKDSSYTDAESFKASLQGVMLYYELAEPEEYPIVTKTAPNYIGSDYGVEQFDSVVPCNANNLYYMRSLAGEIRNFLDRLMAGLDTSDATVVADRILAVVKSAAEPANVEPETPIEE